MKTENDKIAVPLLVASDMGGTLIRGSQGVPDFTASVLNQLANNGVPVALITGYNYFTTLRYTRNLNEKILLLPQNGTLCIKKKALVWEYRIPEASAKELYGYLEEKLLPVIIYKGQAEDFGNFYVHYEDVPALADAFKRLNHLDNFENITGISTLLPDETALKVRTDIERLIGNTFKVIYVRESKGSWLEVVHAEVRKDLALKRLCLELDIPLSRVVYFGDNFNDREVLRLVGHPVLVDNAMPELKEEFSHIVPSVYEEGVAIYLKKLFQLNVE